MHVEQKHVTIVNLHDGQPREFVLQRDEHGFRLTAVSATEVVNVLLSDHDLHKLRREVAKGTAPWQPTVDERFTATPPRGYTLNALDWLSFN
jgi:hypothetical protein